MRISDWSSDVCSSDLKFADLQARVQAESGDTRSVEEMAEGYLAIAVENMANAIKKISVARGYDVTKYVLSSFGGAGGPAFLWRGHGDRRSEEHTSELPQLLRNS